MTSVNVSVMEHFVFHLMKIFVPMHEWENIILF